jgi:phycoerythrin-associated linker protein
VDASSGGKVYRIEVTSIRANSVNRVSKFRRSNQVFLVPYDKLSEQYQRIHQQGGVIASVTAV